MFQVTPVPTDQARFVWLSRIFSEVVDIKKRWLKVIHITVALWLLCSRVLLLPTLVDAHDTISTGGEERLLQFTAAGHVLCFSGDSVIIASMRHMLKVEFLNSRKVAPEIDDSMATAGDTVTTPALSRVFYRNVWEGVNITYEASAPSIVKSTYYLDTTTEKSPAGRIRLGYNRPVQLDEKGNLFILYDDGIMVESAPVAWQETAQGRKLVPVSYSLQGEYEVGFSLGDYVPGVPVIVDPVMTWNSSLGSSGSESGCSISADSSGNVYVTGDSGATWGSPIRPYTEFDAFATKLDRSGTLQWNTFLGGSGYDTGYGISVDSSGNVYVAGFSYSPWGSPVRAYTAGGDAFVAQLNSSGTLQWHTFLGGNGYDSGNGISVDSSGNVYVVGESDATWGSPVRAYTAGDDAFAAKLNSNGTLQWHTFLGGSGYDAGYSIAVDSSNNVYIVGESDTTWGSPVRAYTLYDAFAAKLDSSGTLQWHSFLGGDGYDAGYGIAVDSNGNVFVAGESQATWGYPMRTYTSNDAFVAQLNSSGALQWHTFLGGSGYDAGYGIAVDSSGNIDIVGESFTTWESPVQAYVSDGDAFAARINGSGTLLWNTFLGGGGYDYGFGISVDSSGNIYVVGESSATWGSPVRAYTGYDAFAAKLDGSGTLQWHTFLGGGGGSGSGYGISIDGSGNVYVTGTSDATWGSPLRAYTSGDDAFAAKFDSSGTLQWHTFLGGSGYDHGYSISVDSIGNVYIVGESSTTWGSPVRTNTGYDAFAAQLNSSGTLQWNTFLGGGYDSGSGISIDSSGNISIKGENFATWARTRLPSRISLK